MGAVTPPVALAAYAAAAVSGADVDRTGWLAFRLGLAGYVIPFLCMYFNGLLLVGPPSAILIAIIIATGVIGTAALAVHAVNRSLHPSNPPAPV